MKDSPRLQVGYCGASKAVGVIFWKKEVRGDLQETFRSHFFTDIDDAALEADDSIVMR